MSQKMLTCESKNSLLNVLCYQQCTLDVSKSVVATVGFTVEDDSLTSDQSG